MNKINMIEITTLYDVCVYDEQKWATVSALVEADLLEEADDLNAFDDSSMGKALIDALDKFEENPYEDMWIGECEENPEIVAVLERYRSEDIPEDELAFTAIIHGDISGR